MDTPETIELSLSPAEAVVLYDLLDQYQRSEQPELRTDTAEWRALVLLLGHLERSGAAEGPNYARVLADARQEFGDYDGAPF